MGEKIINRSSISMYEQDQTKYSIVVNRRRAFPEVRDGLKPVQRRVIFGAYSDGLTEPKKKDKSASLVGMVMKHFHPHGDCIDGSSILYQLNGSYITIEEAYKNGIPLNILAIDTSTGSIVPAVAHSFRIGQYTDKIYNIILSNGSVIKCTANHPFMLPNCSYVKAEYIHPYTRLMQKTLIAQKDRRPVFGTDLLQDIVHDFYYGIPESGIDRHHKDGNFWNNDPSNFEDLEHTAHVALHGHDDSSLKGLEIGRQKMFSENGNLREVIKRKNSILIGEFNKDQGLRRFKHVIEELKCLDIPATLENYETLRPNVYNLPRVENLCKKYGLSSFEELVNYKLPTIGELYNSIMNEKENPVEFIEQESISPIDFFYQSRGRIYDMFDKMIDNNVDLSPENYLNFYHNSNVEYQKISYLIDLYRIERPFIENVIIDEVNNVPMYDFTVDGFENMMIPVINQSNLEIQDIIGTNIPFISIHNSSIYDAIVCLQNWFKIKMPLFYGKGNWGNVAGSGAAAMRYTECSLSNFGYDTLIDELAQANNIVDWIPTYKRNGTKEPEFLPAKVPILLINGSFGIGVGMTINIPSHNLVEVLEATRALLRDPNQEIVLIPDLCQACKLIDTDWRSISNTGRGSFKVRGRIEVETNKKGEAILHIVSLPDMVTTTSVYEKILSMVEQKQLPMIKDIFNALDNNEKPDITIYLKQGADVNYVKQVIYAKTDVQKTVSVNFEAVAANGIDTKRFSYKEYLLTFIDQRMNVKFRLYCNRLQQLMTRFHQVDMFIKVIESGEIDTIINMIRKQKSTDATPIIEYAIKKCNITDIQAKFIIHSDLTKLSLGNLNKFKEERKNLDQLIKQYTAAVTDDGSIIRKEIDEELLELETRYGTPRLCQVVSIDDENQIPKGTFKVVITERNYIRKIPDVDRVGIVKKDNPKFILKVDNAENLLIFDNKGKVFNLPISKIPITDRNSSGTDIRILIKNLTSDIISVYYEPIFERIINSGNKHYLTILTKSNTIKKLDIEDFLNVNPGGLMYSKIRDDDEVVGITLTPHNLDVVICSGHNALRTPMKEIPLFKRNATGSKAMDTTDPLNGLSVIYPDASDIVVVTKNGKFNRFSISMLPPHARARKGSGVIKLDSNDEIFNIFGVNETDRIRLVTSEGIEEIAVADIKSKSRLAAGTKMMLSKGIIVRADVVR